MLSPTLKRQASFHEVTEDALADNRAALVHEPGVTAHRRSSSAPLDILEAAAWVSTVLRLQCSPIRNSLTHFATRFGNSASEKPPASRTTTPSRIPPKMDGSVPSRAASARNPSSRTNTFRPRRGAA